jgi:hypothetical protein
VHVLLVARLLRVDTSVLSERVTGLACTCTPGFEVASRLHVNPIQNFSHHRHRMSPPPPHTMPPAGIRTPLEDRLVQLFKEISPHDIAIRTQCSLAIARHILENVRDKVIQHRDELLRNTPDQLTDEAVYRVVETAAMDHIDIPTLAQKRRTTDEVVSRALISVLNETRKLQNARKSNVPSTSGAFTQLLQLGRLDWPESIPEYVLPPKSTHPSSAPAIQQSTSIPLGSTLPIGQLRETPVPPTLS